MTTYAYTRVSTAEQIAGTSMADQAERAAAAAKLRGLPSPTIVRDPGVSAATPLANRPGGAELLRNARAGDTIIALKLDRMFRNAQDALNVAHELKGRGVDLILLDMGTEPVNGDGIGKLMFTLMAAFAELERTRIADRMHAGRAAKKAAGGHIGGAAPFGFCKVGTGRDATLEEDPDQQAAIATIKRGAEAGMSLRAIRDLVHTMHPRVKVSHVTVGHVIERLGKGDEA